MENVGGRLFGTGVTRVREWRDGVPAGSLFVQFVWSFESEEAFCSIKTTRR
jgi:hypothetical protein